MRDGIGLLVAVVVGWTLRMMWEKERQDLLARLVKSRPLDLDLTESDAPQTQR